MFFQQNYVAARPFFFFNDHIISLRMLRSKHKVSLLYKETFILTAVQILIHMHAGNSNWRICFVKNAYYTCSIICMKGISIFFHGKH